MANSATLVDTIPAQVGGMTALREYEIVIDTTGTDLDIMTPTGSNRVWVVGIWLADSAALNLTLKSGSSKSQTWELAANQGLPGIVGNNFYFATKPGEKLSLQSSVAIGASVGKNFKLLVGEAPVFVGK